MKVEQWESDSGPLAQAVHYNRRGRALAKWKHMLDAQRAERQAQREGSKQIALPLELPQSELGRALIAMWPDITVKQVGQIEGNPTFAGVDILAEARRAHTWEKAQRRHKKNHARFLVNWLLNAAERRSTHPMTASTGSVAPMYDKQRTKALLAQLRSGNGEIT